MATFSERVSSDGHTRTRFVPGGGIEQLRYAIGLRRKTLCSARGTRWRVVRVIPGAEESIVTFVAVERE